MPGFQPSCSVVVCTRYRSQTLNTCLEAVTHSDYPDFEIVVVDNSPGDQPTREVAERYNARYVLEPATGLSRARNRGSAASNGDIVAFLDDDTLPERGWLSGLVAQFENRRVMAVVGRTLERNTTGGQRDSASTGEFVDFGGRETKLIDRDSPAWFQRANFGGIGNGMNMAFRRQAWQVWPGFDERLGLGATIEGGEEHYAFFSLIDRGFAVIYAADAVVRHPSTQRTPQQVRDRFLQDCVAAGAYVAFLYWEEPRYRSEVLGFVGEWLLGVRRPWKSAAPITPPVVPRWQILFNRCRGIFVYLWFRIADASARKSGTAQHHGDRAPGQPSPQVVSTPRSEK